MSYVKLLSLTCQVVGVAAIVCAVWLLAGFGWSLLAGGLVLAAVGTLAEGGKL